MPSTRPTTRQGWTKIVQSTTNLSVRVANWQCQIPISSVTRTWCRMPTNPQAATTQCQVSYLQDIWVFRRWVNQSPTYRGVQDNATGYGKKPIIRSTRAQCWTPAGGPQHGTRHSIYRMSELHQWMNFWRTRVGRTMPGANHSGRLLSMPIDPILGNSTRRSGRQHMRCKVCMLPCQAPFMGAPLHQVGNRSWSISPPKSYSFIYPNPLHPVTRGIIPVSQSIKTLANEYNADMLTLIVGTKPELA